MPLIPFNFVRVRQREGTVFSGSRAEKRTEPSDFFGIIDLIFAGVWKINEKTIETMETRRNAEPVSLGELAVAYFPAPRRASSVRRMRRWIMADETLRLALEAVGYRAGRRRLTAAQVDVFRRILGEP